MKSNPSVFNEYDGDDGTSETQIAYGLRVWV